MSKKYKSVKIQTKDGKESKYVDLYPITEVGIPRKAFDTNIWEVPEGYYAIDATLDKREPYTDTIKRIHPSTDETNEIFVHLYSMNDIIDERPRNSLDPEIWNIPAGYFAVEKISDNKRYKSVKLKLKEGNESLDLPKFKYAVLYFILPEAEIPREALDPKIWEIPEGFYAIEPKPYIGEVYLRNPRIHKKGVFEDPAPPFNPTPATLYPIEEGKEIPKNTLDPKIWKIPTGYYAIEGFDPNISLLIF